MNNGINAVIQLNLYVNLYVFYVIIGTKRKIQHRKKFNYKKIHTMRSIYVMSKIYK